MKKLIAGLLLVGPHYYGQERLGISNSNFASAHSIHLNPSSSADSRTFMQLNLLGVNVFAKTNVGYLPQFSLWSARSSGVPAPVVNEADRNRYFYGNAIVEGPTFVYSKNNFGAGFFVRGRTIAEARRLPYTILNSFLALDATEPAGEMRVRNAIISNMSWVEYGLNFSGIIKKRNHDLITLGTNLKYLTGLNIMYANLSRLEGEFSADEARIDELSARARYNTLAFGSGRGFALDLGFTYKKMLEHVDSYYPHSKRSHCSYIDYLYKIGVTVRDAGYIRFNPPVTRSEITGIGLLNTEGGANSIDDIFGPQFTITEESGTPVTAAMPALVSVQGDYNFQNHFYFNLTVIKGVIPNSWTGVRAADLIALTPRFETKNLEVALPLTLHRYIHPNVGFALRIRTLVIGVDNVFPLLFKSNTATLNAYFSIGISLFKNPRCSGRVKRIDDCAPKVKIRKEKRSKRGYRMRNHR